MNRKLIIRLTGTLLLFESIAFAVCFAISAAYGDSDISAFGFSAIIALSLGMLLRYISRDASAVLTRYDSYVAVTVAWLSSTLIGMLPYILSGALPDVSDAFFETMSGFTTTGSTMIDDIDVQSHGILFWRSVTNWIGGLGIVLFTLAILPSNGSGETKLFAAEITGPTKNKLHPRLKTTIHWLWSIYLLLTVLCVISLYLAGMGKFDAVCHGLTTTATGGFSTHNDSIAFFHSPTIEYVEIFFMFLSGINFAMLYSLFFRGKVKLFFGNSEIKAYAIIVGVATAFIAVCLYNKNGLSSADAVRTALFQVVSISTSTGFTSADFMKWMPLTWIVLSILMFIGACAGSTSGGFKIVRIIAMLKITGNEFKSILHPAAVVPVRINGQAVSHKTFHTLIAFSTLYVITLCAGVFLLAISGLPLMDSLGMALSSISNIGPEIGRAYGELSSWSSIPVLGKWVCSFLMLLGRLELFSIFVLFTPRFWKDN